MAQGITFFTYSDHYTQCIANYFQLTCNTTLTKANAFAAPVPRGSLRKVTLKCRECVLETFPNEILDSYFEWNELHFDDSHIKHLNMSSLNATVANQIWILYLRRNAITQLDAESLPNAENLHDLNLSHNLIESVTGNETIRKLKRLDTLNMAHNCLTHLDPMVFHNLNLSFLILNNNRLLETSFIYHLNADTELWLSNNPIASLQMINVHIIHLQNTSITTCSVGQNVNALVITDGILQTIDLPPSSYQISLLNLSSNRLTLFRFPNPQLLKLLDLYDNKLQTINVWNARYLRSINLARNLITTTINMSLPDSLMELNLAHNKITNLDGRVFRNLKQLQYLDMAHCGLHTVNAEIFAPTRLKHLDLSYNRFVTMDLNVFKGLKGLEQLNLNGNRLADLNVEDTKRPAQLGIANNDWKCTRLQVIVNVLMQRNAIIFHEPCGNYDCKVNVRGIACHSDDYEADSAAAVASNENNEADDRFRVHEDLIWQTEQDNVTANDPETTDPQNLSSIVREMSLDLRNILNDFQEKHSSRSGDNRTELDSNLNNFKRNISKELRDIFERVKRLRDVTNGFLMELNSRTDELGNLTETITRREPKADRQHISAIVFTLIGILVLLAAALYCSIVVIRKRREQGNIYYIANFSEVY